MSSSIKDLLDYNIVKKCNKCGSSATTNTGVTKGFIRVNYIESNMEEDIDMKNQFKIKTFQILQIYKILLQNFM